ncbi:MAG: hypothetical protein LBG64_03955 [Pseudomonadales bacterium]|nr:hypothetical protein [Pseudomonadales bacterium]
MSGDNENGRLVLELSPEDFMRDRYTIYPAFLATIRDDSGRKIISRRAFHVKTANGQYLDEYGLFEINNYAFRIRLIEEQTGWFIFSGTDRFIARVLYVDLAD